MKQQYRILKVSGILCHIRQGVFLIFLLSSISCIIAKPVVGLSVGIVDNSYHINVTGESIGGFKSGIIEFEYLSSVDINKVLVGSSISTVGLGASIDRTNHKLRIIISTTKQISIESGSLFSIDLPLLNNIDQLSVLKILNASFTDQSGVTQTSTISQSVKTIIAYRKYREKTEVFKSDHFVQLNGRYISLKTMQNYKQRASGYFIPQRILCKECYLK